MMQKLTKNHFEKIGFFTKSFETFYSEGHFEKFKIFYLHYHILKKIFRLVVDIMHMVTMVSVFSL